MPEDRKPEDPSGQAPKHVNVSINLLAALGKFAIQLQHLADFVSIGVTGASKVDDADYQRSPFSHSFQIAGEQRIPFPKIKDDFANWCIKNSFTEAIDILGALLEECRLVAALYTLGNGTISGEQWNHVWFKDRTSFHKLSFPDKISHLKTKYGVQSEFEVFVLSLNAARRCLIHRLGIVGAEDLKNDECLTVRWYGIEPLMVDTVTGEEIHVEEQRPATNESNFSLRLGPVEKQFRSGERIFFSPTQLFHTIYTFYRFAVDLLKFVEQMAPPTANNPPAPVTSGS